MADSLRLARGAWPSRCGRYRRWRALFEGPFGRSPERIELGAKQQLGHAAHPR